MSEIAAALDLIYEDDDTGEAAILAGVPVRIRVQSRLGEVSPFAAQFQSDGLLVYLRRSEVPTAPDRDAALVREATGEVFVVRSARPRGRFEWFLELAQGDQP